MILQKLQTAKKRVCAAEKNQRLLNHLELDLADQRIDPLGCGGLGGDVECGDHIAFGIQQGDQAVRPEGRAAVGVDVGRACCASALMDPHCCSLLQNHSRECVGGAAAGG